MTFLALRTRALRGSDVLCVSDSGRFFVGPGDFEERLGSGALSDADLAFLTREGHAIADNDELGAVAHAFALGERLNHPELLDYLILVPTLRCNLSCSYCQVSRASLGALGFDWSDATLAAVLDQLDGLSTDRLKVEFQGGEPTLRPDLIRAVMARCERFARREFVICTNLQELTPEILDLFDREDVFISTSLDGDAATHGKHRTGDQTATDGFLANLRFVIDRYGSGRVSALPTIDPAAPPDCDTLIDAYASLGLDHIFLRPINYQGFARKRHKHAREQDEAWRAYHERFVRRLIERNWQDRSRVLSESYFTICLRRIFQPGRDRHVDLRSPNPMGVDYIVVDHDGTVYPTDEARMLSRAGVIDLSIGDVAAGWDTEARALLNLHATNQHDPACQSCTYQPFCGRDLVDDIARYGRIDMPRHETEFCRRHLHMFDFIFSLIYEDDSAVRYSLSRWLRLPGTPTALGERLPGRGLSSMIPLNLPAMAEAERPYVTRLRRRDQAGSLDSVLVGSDAHGGTFAGPHGLITVDGVPGDALDGDVVLVRPEVRPGTSGRIERLLRAGSRHNTLLVTERCDQLCVMCSQPPKKTHVDRFDFLEQACQLAEPGSLIGITGGEPTLYKDELLGLIERVLSARSDLGFHVLSNGQHFEREDVERLRQPLYGRVSWGIHFMHPIPRCTTRSSRKTAPSPVWSRVSLTC